MQIITVDNQLIEAGRASFESCLRQYLSYGDTERTSGIKVIPGAIVAALEAGLTRSRDIIRAAARVSRCRGNTVYQVLTELGAPSFKNRLWERYHEDRYRLVHKENRDAFLIMTDAAPPIEAGWPS